MMAPYHLIRIVLILAASLPLTIQAENESIGRFAEAVQKGDLEVMQEMLDAGFDPNTRIPDSKLEYSPFSEPTQPAVKEEPPKEGEAPDNVGQKGKTALMMTLSSDLNLNEEKIPAMVRLLIKSGANPNLTDSEGANALILALDSYDCAPETIDAILDAKPDISHRDKDGRDALFHAMSNDKTRGLTFRLIELGADIKTMDDNGVDLLMLAAEGNDPKQVRFLLDHGLSPDRKAKSGESAVHYAFQAGQWKTVTASIMESIEKRKLEIINLLHQRGASLTEPDADGDTPLHFAASSGRIEIFTYLLPFYKHLDIKTHLGETPLHLAAASSSEIVDLLLPSYPDPDVRDADSWTPFMVASEYDNKAAQESLLKAGADIDATDKTGTTVLDMAVTDNNPDKIRFLIEHGADPRKLRDMDSRFLRVARLYQDEPSKTKNYASLVEVLAHIAHDINSRDGDQMTALMWVAASNNMVALEAVLKHHPDLNLRSPDGRTALMWAACSRAEQAMEILRKAGADASFRDSTGRSADEWLAWSKGQNTGITLVTGDDKLLLESLSKGRKNKLLAYLGQHDKWSKDDRVAGMPPLHLAATLGDVGAIKELLKRGAPVDQLHEDQSTLLMTAAANDETEAVQLLLDQGADPALRDFHGRRAIDLAVGLKHPTTARLFLRGEKPFSPDESTLLATLVQTGDETLLREFLKAGSSISPVVKLPDNDDPFGRDRNGPSPEAPWVAAAMQADSKMLGILAEFPRATEADNPDLLAIALQTAAENGRLDNVKFFIEKLKADPDSMLDDSFGGVIRVGSSDQDATKPVELFTALSRALEEGHLDIVRYLVGKGATITGRTRSGAPPLTFVVEHHQLDLLEYFLKHKAATGLFDLGGETALHVAASMDDESATRLLLDHGADPKTKSSNGKTPLERARQMKATKAAALLESREK